MTGKWHLFHRPDPTKDARQSHQMVEGRYLRRIRRRQVLLAERLLLSIVEGVHPFKRQTAGIPPTQLHISSCFPLRPK